MICFCVGRGARVITYINTVCVREGEIYSCHQLILHVCLGRGKALIITVCGIGKPSTHY